MQKQQVPVDKLQFGMYVAALDRPWTETPFMYQGFHLRTDVQLAALKKFCKHVFIDLEKTDKSAAATAPQTVFKVRGSTAYPETVKVEVEFQRAETLFVQTEKAIDDLLKP